MSIPNTGPWRAMTAAFGVGSMISKRAGPHASPLPLKKRRKMHHYPIALAINRQQVPNLWFTIEEEFRSGKHFFAMKDGYDLNSVRLVQ